MTNAGRPALRHAAVEEPRADDRLLAAIGAAASDPRGGEGLDEGRPRDGGVPFQARRRRQSRHRMLYEISSMSAAPRLARSRRGRRLASLDRRRAERVVPPYPLDVEYASELPRGEAH